MAEKVNLKLSDRAEIRSSKRGGSMGLYTDGELYRPLNALEEHMAKRVQGLEAWRENLLNKWDTISDRPDGGELIDLGNAMHDSPEYTHRRHTEQVRLLQERIKELEHAINLAKEPAQQLREEMERISQPGYMWPRLAAEQIESALNWEES